MAMEARQARDGAIIAPSFAYGFSTSIQGNVCHLEGQKLLYPAGQFFAVMGTHADDGKATFFSSHSSVKAVRGLRLAGNKNYLAAVEQTFDDEAQQVSVYSVPAEKHLRTITLDRQHTHATTVVGLSFSGDAKLLLVAAGEPDYSIMVWRWYSSKLALVITPELSVCCAAFNPWDDSLLAVAGPHNVRSYRLDLVTANAKPNNLLMLDHSGSIAITCIAYLVGGMLAVGTSTGRIMVYSETGLVASMDISTAADSPANSSSGSSQQQHGPASQARSRPSSQTGAVVAPRLPHSAAVNGVQALVQRGRGFIAAGSMWDVYLFDPSGATSKRASGPDVFGMTRCFSFAAAVGCSSQLKLNPASSTVVAFSNTSSGIENSSTALAADARVLGLSVSVTDDHVALTTAAGKLLLLDVTAAAAAEDEAAAAAATATAASAVAGGSDAEAAVGSPPTDSLSGAESEFDPADPNPSGWQVLCAGFPSARVVGLDACLHLPLLLVVSEDRWVRVWDWVRRTRVAARHVPDEQPLCCALHPSGFMAALGSSEGLRTYYILRRELLPVADLPVAKCSVARYSHGGALLAAVGRTNAIVIYPAYYGAGGGASGASPPTGGSSSHYAQRSSAGDSGRGSGGYFSAAAAAAASGIGTDGACVMRPLFVLKAHVSSVTDLVFSGDDRRLVSSGAGGAVYFWDMSTGARLMELEYVDKQCVYYTACYNDRHAAAVVRTMDGRVQHIQDGQLAYELAGLGNDASPMAITGDGRVVLACTNTGSIISIAWPKDPEAAGRRQQEEQQQSRAASNGAVLADTAAGMEDAHGAAGSHAAQAMKHLSVQVGSGPLLSPRASGYAAAAAKTPGSTLSARTPHTAKTPHGAAASARTPGSWRAANSPSFAAANHHPGSDPQQPHQHHQQLQVVLDAPGTPADSADAYSELTSPGPLSPGPLSHAPASPSRSSRAWPAAEEGAAAAAVTPGHGRMKEYRLHSSRITAIKVLHTAGVVFTASVDGLVMMSSLTLVLDGILTEPPPLALPPSATAAGSAETAAAAAISLGSGLTAASLGALVPAGGVPGLPLPVVLVDEGLLLAMRERLRAMAAAVTAAQKEAQYQVLRQTQALKESLRLSDSQAAQLSREVAQLRTALAETQVAADTNQQQVAKELESLHAAAAEQLEGLYEARLALEGERLAQLAAAKDDLELSLKEEMRRQAATAERQLAEVHNMYRQQLAAEAAKGESAAAAAAEAAAVWQEVLMQTEEDLELQAERDGDRLAAARHEAGEVEMKLKAEINVLLRSNGRLKADKAADAAQIDALASQLSGLKQQLAEAAAVADKLRGELAERDGVIGDNYASLQGLRRRVQELETHKFVLGCKAEAAASQLQPKEEQLAEMHQTLDAQGRELLAARSALLAAQRVLSEKSAAVAAAKQELWEAKQTMTRQAGQLEAVAHDIFQVLQQPDERIPGGKTARQQALEQLAVKYCTNRGGGARSSVQVEAEMLAHIAAAEKKSRLLEEQLKHALAGKSRTGRRLMADNAALMNDLAELQHSNRDLARQLAAATDQLAHFTGVQFAASNNSANAACSGGAVAYTAGAADVADAGAAGSRPASAALSQGRPGSAGYVPAFLTAAGSRPASPGRRQGATAAGRLLPPSTGRVLNAALEQQQQQLAELQSLLASTAAVVATQAAQITRLQDTASDSRQQQQQSPTGRAHALVSASAADRQASGRLVGSNDAGNSSMGEYVQGLALAYDLQEQGPHTAHVAAPDPAGVSSSSITKGSKWLKAQPVTQQHAGAGWRPDSAAARAGQGSSSSSSSRPASPGSQAASLLRSSWNSSPSKGGTHGAAGSHGSSIRPSSAGRTRPMTASAAVRPTGSLVNASDGQQQQRQQQGLAFGSAGNLIGLGEDVGAGSSGRRTPPANLPKRWPTTAGGVGMLACLRSDLEAWRAK
uniref:Uncharacterized protein n=1 Tax=Tetradesmus obliquus TaxID=3088 RepID=A0A383W626_TETOB|eukprot:jgi/Sobl393_1/7366/SZX72670.1